jgi:uncharacterized membrane protein YidH (DUF202 family)
MSSTSSLALIAAGVVTVTFLVTSVAVVGIVMGEAEVSFVFVCVSIVVVAVVKNVVAFCKVESRVEQQTLIKLHNISHTFVVL